MWQKILINIYGGRALSPFIQGILAEGPAVAERSYDDNEISFDTPPALSAIRGCGWICVCLSSAQCGVSTREQRWVGVSSFTADFASFISPAEGEVYRRMGRKSSFGWAAEVGELMWF